MATIPDGGAGAPAAALRLGAWVAVGLLASGGLLILTALFPLGIALPVAALALALRVEARFGRAPASWGTPIGLAAAPLYLAIANRGGPGESCSAIDGGVECAELWDPRPWALIAAALVAVGVVGYGLAHARRPHARPHRAPR